jgi:hypothetical protein
MQKHCTRQILNDLLQTYLFIERILEAACNEESMVTSYGFRQATQRPAISIFSSPVGRVQRQSGANKASINRHRQKRAQNDRNSVSNLRKKTSPFDDSQPSNHPSSAVASHYIICSIDIEQQIVQPGQHCTVNGSGPFGYMVKTRK